MEILEGDKMLYIVCEGICNRELAEHDALVRQLKAAKTSLGRRAGQTMKLMELVAVTARHLAHTPHKLNGTGPARCQLCGHTRAW